MNPLSVIIPSRNAVNLAACLAALRSQEPRACAIVVDDGIDISAAVIAPYREVSSYLIEGVKPFVFARNVNLGIQAAITDDVILLNDDALLETPGGFALMQQAAYEHPEYGVISASCNLASAMQHRQLGGRLRDARGLNVAFVCVLIPRRTLDLVGLLDERFTAYGFDDDDYCRRVRNAGMKVGVFDGCYVDHGSLTSTFRGDPRAPADLTAGRAIYEAKWGGNA